MTSRRQVLCGVCGLGLALATTGGPADDQAAALDKDPGPCRNCQGAGAVPCMLASPYAHLFVNCYHVKSNLLVISS